jgi:nitrogen fixation protein FixH
MGDQPRPHASREAETRHRLFWVGLILALLGGQILLLLIMAYLATSDASFAIEPDYYQKGIQWDATALQQRRNAQLGWSLRIDLGDQVSPLGERMFACVLKDRDGRPLDGATIDLVAFPHARGNERTAVTLVPAGDGRYDTTLRMTRKGVWEFRFVVHRGPETFTHTEQRGVYPPGESRSWRP